MDDSFQVNLQLINQRWPQLYSLLIQAADEQCRPQVELAEGLDSTLLINGIQLTSRHSRQQEAQQQISVLPANSKQVTLYGTGLGDMQRQLLAMPQLQRLTICILNEYIFALVLQLLDQSDWLADPRVSLQLASEQPEIQLPFVTLPSELVLASDRNLKMCDRLQAELNARYAARNFEQAISPYLPRLQQNKEFWQSDKPVQTLFNSLTSTQKEVWVIAAGPSLEQHYAYLFQRKQQADMPLLICVDTAVKGLLAHQIVPDIIVSRDHKITLWHLPCAELPATTRLVYFPLANPALLAGFPGPRYVALSDSEVFEPVRHQLAAASLFSYGSVIHPAVDLAVKMGAKRIVLFGADFAFSHSKTHAGWQNGTIAHPVQQANEQVINGFGEKMPTLRNLLTYLTGLERYISQHPQIEFFNTSRSGAVIAGTEYYTGVMADG